MCFFPKHFPMTAGRLYTLGLWNSENQLEMLLFTAALPHVWNIYISISPSKKRTSRKIIQFRYIPLNQVYMEVSQNMSTPKSFILRSDSPWSKTSSYWGTMTSATPDTPRRIRSMRIPSLQQACGWQNNHPKAFRHGNDPQCVQSRDEEREEQAPNVMDYNGIVTRHGIAIHRIVVGLDMGLKWDYTLSLGINWMGLYTFNGIQYIYLMGLSPDIPRICSTGKKGIPPTKLGDLPPSPWQTPSYHPAGQIFGGRISPSQTDDKTWI